MTTPVFEIMAPLLAVTIVGAAVKKLHIFRNRQRILSNIHKALTERKALWSGILAGVFYLAIYMILGGRGGRIHYRFGRVIWNTSPGDVLAGILLAVLVMLSIALFVYGVRVMGAKPSGNKGGLGFWGSLLALLAAFCP